jgi:hypothetical protein
MSLKNLKSFVDDLKVDLKNSHGYRAASSFVMLEDVDLMIERYLKEKQTDKGAILLDVFGLLQGLFVAIDALYDLAIGLTQYKYHVNINLNKALHELKYIRNDIVGHPTHRTYNDGGVGFSLIIQDSISKEKLSYETYIYEKNNVEVKTKEVLFKPLIEAYHEEKDIILANIFQYLKHDETKTNIPEQIYTLFETFDLELLKKIKEDFCKEYLIEETNSHRFLWRISLLEKIILWDEVDKELVELVLYMGKLQASKLYDMALDLEKRRSQDLYAPIPQIVHTFYKFIRRNESVAIKLLDNLHDFNHPFYQRDLIALMALNPPKGAAKCLRFLKNQTDEQKAFLIGSVLRSYRPKSK